MADIVVSVGSSSVINTMNGDEYQIYKILENIETQLSNKVDKVTGKGLSSNDYTAEEKTKLSKLPTKTELDTDLSGKEDTANKVTTLNSNSTDTQYPSAKAVYDELVKKTDMQTSSGGFEGGSGAKSWGMGAAAVGMNATALDGGGAIGNEATALGGGAVGDGAYAQLGFSGGYNAKTKYNNTAIDAIQLGTGTNPNEKTLQIYDYQLMDADGHIPNDRMPTKADKTTITTSTETSPSITLADNTEVRCDEITSLTVTIPETISDSFISSAVFKSGATATTVTVPSDVYCQGADCKNGAFLPKANKRYTMIFSYDGIMNCYIAAVPIQTAETQSVDDFPAANDESVAEPTESVAEEPESEPNEVI